MRLVHILLFSLLAACGKEAEGDSATDPVDDVEQEPDLTQGGTCDSQSIGDCVVETCCDIDNCFYDADGEIFPCDGTDCEDAANDVVAYCN